MKKTLAILLALALVFSSISFTFAEETLPVDAQAAKDLGMLVGDQSGVTVNYLNTAPQRIQAAIMVLRLKGLEDDAKAFTGTDNFADADKAAWAKPIMAYLKANPQVGFGGVGNNTFNPAGLMDAKSYYKVMLETLGYKQTTTEVAGDFTWDNLLTFAAEKNLKTVANATNFTVANVATATMETLKANVKGATKTLADSLVEAKVITAEQAAKAGLVSELAVDSVVANTAKSFQVKFNKAVADTSAMKFAVTRGTVAATMTTTWNDAKTVATLTAAAKLPEAKYSVAVTNGTTEMVKKEVEITKEVVKNIEYVQNTILRTNNFEGIANFKVYNQYGEDVTNLALGRSLSFITSTSVSVPTADYKSGTLKITHGKVNDVFQLKDMKTVTVTARDISTGFVQTNVLNVSETVGVVADVKLLGIVDENGKTVDFKFDTTKSYYLDYEATDVLGNKITNFDALDAELYPRLDNAGNIIKGSGQRVLQVTGSSQYVTVTREKHPQDSTKLAFRLQLNAPVPPATYDYDTPISFMAMAPFAGKNSNLTVTLLRAAAVDKFVMQNPVETASRNKAIEIPFEAFDQNGNAVTMYDDLNGKIQFSTTDVKFVKQADGKAKLFGTFAAKQTYYITSTVNGSLTGSFSQIAIDVKDTAIATTIEPLRHTKAYLNTSEWDDSLRVSSFTVRDQFDNKMNLRSDALGNKFGIRISTSKASVVDVANKTTSATVTTVDGYEKSIIITGDEVVKFTGGNTAGTATILYELVNLDADGNLTLGDIAYIDSASAVAYNVERKDIKSIAYTASADPIYMASGDSVAVNLIAKEELAADNTVVGKTSSGMEVFLPSDSKLWFTTSNDKFRIDTVGDVYADGTFGTNDHTASSIVTAYYEGTNGVLSASVTINASDAAPVVSSISANYDYPARRSGYTPVANGGMTVTNDVVEVTQAWFNANIVGRDLYKYGKDGNAVANRALVYFTASSQYGAWTIDNVNIVKSVSGVGSNATLQITNANSGTVGYAAGAVTSGDQFTFTAMSNNGKIKVVTFKIK